MSKFWVAVEMDSYTVPGDERSRTNPGHGYPEHTVATETITRFTTIEGLTEWVRRREDSPYSKKYEIWECEALKVEREVSVRAVKP